MAISVGCQDVGDVRQKGRGLYDPVMQNGCSVRAFDPIPIRPLEKESLWPFSLHFYTFRVTSHSYALCSWGANMSKKIAEASSVDFHTQLAWLMP